MRLLTVPLVAALASSGWALAEMPRPRPPNVVAVIPQALAAESVPAAPPRALRRPPILASPPVLLPRVALVQGKIFEADRHPAEYLEVILDGGDQGELHVRTDNTGAFSAIVAPGEYTVSPVDRTLTTDEPDLTLAPGEEVRGLQLTLEPEREEEERGCGDCEEGAKSDEARPQS